jgi:hypothetical protein
MSSSSHVSRGGLYLMVFLTMMNTCSVASKQDVRDLKNACTSQVE